MELLFLSGTLPVEDGAPKFLGHIGAELSVEDGRRATRLAALNALALAKQHLDSLDRVTRVLRLGISLATTPEFREHPKVADAASELLVTLRSGCSGKVSFSCSSVTMASVSHAQAVPAEAH